MSVRDGEEAEHTDIELNISDTNDNSSGRDHGERDPVRDLKSGEDKNEHPRDRKAGKDLRAQLKAAMDSTRGRKFDEWGDEVVDPDKPAKDTSPREKDGKFAGKKDDTAKVDAPAKAAKAPDANTEIPPQEKPATVPVAAVESKAAVAPPDALSKELKAQWATLPDPVRAEFVRLEEAAKKGVEPLKARVSAYDNAFAPLRQELQTIGLSESEGLEKLVLWRQALRGPQKVQAFRALAQAEGIDLATLIGPQAAREAQYQQPQTQFDPSFIQPYVAPLANDVNALKARLDTQERERVNSDIAKMSNGKPHFDRVRTAMGHLIQAGLAQGNNETEIFDDAYARACRADPEIYASMLQEDQTKRAAEAQAAQEAAAKAAAEQEAERKRKEREAVEKARKAGVGSRGSTPSGHVLQGMKRGESVGDTLRRAMADARGSI